MTAGISIVISLRTSLNSMPASRDVCIDSHAHNRSPYQVASVHSHSDIKHPGERESARAEKL